MHRPSLFTLLCLLALPRAASALTPLPAEAVKAVVVIPVKFFDLAEVVVTQPEFDEARERDRGYLLQLGPDRLLHTFRLNVKLPSKAEPYGGWEKPDMELRGHSLGHYLSALSLMYRSGGSDEPKKRIDYIVQELSRCQEASVAAGYHAGYLSAFPESFIDRVENRQDVWAPWYTLHKIMAGLLDAHQLAGNQQAREVLVKMAGWVKYRVDRLTPEKMQASLDTEFGGMNEVLANLYSLTGDPDHLRLARAFNHAKVLEPLARGEDNLDGIHANTQIPKMIGAARQYELTGDESFHKIAETFWNRVALQRSYVTGGHSDGEYFFPITDFAKHLSPETTETCNTYNMLKLTRHLWSWKPDAREMDFYERALYNHILASQDPAQGMFAYLLSLKPGHFQTYSTPENSFWCCVGTGMENHAKYGESIYAHSDKDLYVNLFISSELKWTDRGVNLRQETHFPTDGQVKLTWTVQQPTELTLKIRQPGWIQSASENVFVNGLKVETSIDAAGYAEINRIWKTGDTVNVSFPLTLHSEELPGNPNIVAVLYGPLVLSGKLGTTGMPLPYAFDQLDQTRVPDPAVPAFVSLDKNWLSKIEIVTAHPLLFRTRGLGQPNDVFLAPLKDVHNERNAVYWRLMSQADWNKAAAETTALKDRWSASLAVAVDSVKPADIASESAHGVSMEKTQSGILAGQGWRYAENGGSFSYTLKTGGKDSLDLICVYRGDDKPLKFDLYVGDKLIASPELQANAVLPLIVATYSLPRDLVAGKASITVRFVSGKDWPRATANVFGVALVHASAVTAQ